jgi:hypothetical protein
VWLFAAPTEAMAVTAMQIVITGGAHAGTYALPAQNVICMYTAKRRQFSVAYKDTSAVSAKAVSGAGVNVFDAETPASTRSQINISFGDPKDQKPAAYDLWVPRDTPGPVKLVRQRSTAELSFEGQAKDGARLRITATCDSVETF